MPLHIEPLFSLTETQYADREIVLDPATGATAIRRCPVLWSDTACTILFSKYARRAGVPGSPDGETDAEAIFERLARAWAVWGVKQGHIAPDDALLFLAECAAMLAQQVMAPNSPQWFNTGLSIKYGIRGPAQGHWAIDDLDPAPVPRVIECEDAYSNPQISACFIQSVSDSLVGEGGIMDLFTREARLFKYGGGSGSNYSAIRGKGEPLAGGGTSSGLLSFLAVGDTSAGAIKSGGTVRRAARMVTVDVDHPDIESFITWKANEERKIRALQAAGYSGGMEGEAATSAQGQNANNSVRVTDAFMEAVKDDGAWDLTWRTNGNVCKSVHARDLWEQIAQAAWSCADPGLQFHTTINDWHTCPADGEQVATNPCQPAFAPVLTPNGISTIGAIEIGSTIWTGSQWAQVKRKIATGIKPVQVYHTTAGRVICTAEHKVFLDGERVSAHAAEAIDTSQGERVHGGALDPKDVMDGLVFGDGSYRADAAPGHRMLLAIGKDDGCYHTSEIAHLLKESRFGYHKYAWSVSTTLDYLPHTHEREVPERFYQGSAQKVCGFLRGLYSANGSIVGRGSCGRVTLKAASFAVICAVQEMLSSVGIRAYYTTNKPTAIEFSNGTYTCKQSYDLNITADCARFRLLIGFVHPGKCERLDAIIAAKGKASKPPKATFEVKRIEELGEMPVWDIEVDAPEHSYWTGGHRVSNCSEFSWLDDTACNLASINLVRFLTSAGSFDFERFRAAVRLCTIVLDVSVNMAGYPTKRIAERSRDYRTLGLGYANLGGLLMRMGIPYDSVQGRDLCSEITSVMGARSWLTSAEISRELGAFPRFAANREHVLAVLKKHYTAATDASISNYCCQEWALAITHVKNHGARNAQCTLLAPTGTIGLVMDCDTTGIEPAWSLVAFKQLAGGGSLTIPCEAAQNYLDSDDALSALVRIQDDGSLAFLGVHASVESRTRNVLRCANDLSAEAHLGMMAAAQPFLCGAISKTVNLPESATVADVAATYLRAHELGLKAIAVYRDKCKATEVYSSGPAPTGEPSPAAPESDALRAAGALQWGDRRRPERGEDGTMGAAQGAVLRVAGDDWYLHTHTWTDGQPCEIFLTSNRQGSAVAGWSQVTAILASLALQYGCPVSELVEKLRYQRFDPADFRSTSPVDAVAQALARMFGELPEERATPTNTPNRTHSEPSARATTGDTCSVCGSSDMRRSGACFVCGTCGTTSGCS
jgi:ribonucleoside-diphosphate reductase alpha chain